MYTCTTVCILAVKLICITQIYMSPLWRIYIYWITVHQCRCLLPNWRSSSFMSVSMCSFKRLTAWKSSLSLANLRLMSTLCSTLTMGDGSGLLTTTGWRSLTGCSIAAGRPAVRIRFTDIGKLMFVAGCSLPHLDAALYWLELMGSGGQVVGRLQFSSLSLLQLPRSACVIEPTLLWHVRRCLTALSLLLVV